ncbi:unnamed protein product [Durusdinium trenchii]|uniref:Uncharacterized protein n=1 Tax=Durusdinium trenchii TaxID=1381693 RepID=A0ABP0R265_9DINO
MPFVRVPRLLVVVVFGLSLTSRTFSQPQERPKDDVLTTADLQRAAKRLNVELRENVAGPWYQIELYSGDRQLGKTSGWAQPWGSLHLETIEVRKFTGYWVAKPGKESEASEDAERKRYADVAKVARWFGLLLSCAIACWNRERSPFFCKEAYLLAIKDEEKQHDRLVRYYKGLGFKVIKDPETLEYQDQAALTCCLLAPAWLGPTCPKFSRRAIGIIIPLTILGPTESGADVHVVRPQNVTDGAFYSFDVPDSFKAVNRAKYQRDRQLLGKTAEYVSDSGARVFTGESPSEDFVKRRRLTVPRSQQKVLKYVLGEKEDLLECIVKEPQEDGGEMLKHRWWRVLKDGGTSAIMDLDLKEDQLKEFGPEMEAILQSFRLGN